MLFFSILVFFAANNPTIAQPSEKVRHLVSAATHLIYHEIFCAPQGYEYEELHRVLYGNLVGSDLELKSFTNYMVVMGMFYGQWGESHTYSCRQSTEIIELLLENLRQ
ncbi:hypothetical protein CHH27_21335 [Labrenzia sp. VG12]|nr:hypothetical protein CHH27_21335 [Labrenzia sp. VG12]